ncbi:MAG: outer membrane beta-barrel protein [Acidobacteria bacterium]|nr:outer membrane beta-barrel protein [Acidobacteriota bacterium]
MGLALLMTVPSGASSIGVGYAYWDSKDAGEDEGIGIRVAFDINESVDLEFRASFFDAFGQIANNALTRLEVTPVDLGFSYHFNKDGKAQPYLGAGGTFLLINALFDGGQVPVSGGPEVDDEFGFYLVAGVDVAVTELFGVFGEALFRQAELNVTGNGFEFTDFPSDLSGPAATVGLMLHW